MAGIKDELTTLETKEKRIVDNKVANFAYEDSAYTDEEHYADSVSSYDFDSPQNIPLAQADILQVNSTVLLKGFRSQASSVTRMLLNHFFGRTSYNLNKINDNVYTLIQKLKGAIGTANGIASLDANAHIPASQLPAEAVQKVNGVPPVNGDVVNVLVKDRTAYNNMPLADKKGKFFLVENVDTTQQIAINDNTVATDSTWSSSKSNATFVKTINGVAPSNGEVNNVIPVTQAQYNALTLAQKKGKFFLITDAESTAVTRIKDDVTALDTTWSSSKINSNLNNALANYTPFSNRNKDNIADANDLPEGNYMGNNLTNGLAGWTSYFTSKINNDSKYKVQVAISNVGYTKFRICANNVWGEWQKHTTETDVNNALKDIVKIKTTIITKTTNSSGLVTPELPNATYYIILGGYCTNLQDKVLRFGKYNDTRWVEVTNYNGSPVTDTEVTLTLSYI